MFRRILIAALAFALPAMAQTPQTVFAAASMTDALRQVDQLWVAKGNPALRFNFAASSTLPWPLYLAYAG